MDITNEIFSVLKDTDSNDTNKNEATQEQPSFDFIGTVFKNLNEAEDKQEDPFADFDFENMSFGDEKSDEEEEADKDDDESDSENEAEDENIDEISEESEDLSDNSEEDDNEDSNDSSEEEDNEDDSSNDEEDDDDSSSDDEKEEKTDGEIVGEFSEIKDEILAHREQLSEVYERFFKKVISPLFRKLEDYNLNVSFDTRRLKTHGIIRVELSHMNSSSSAEMEINIFADSVSGEFLGLENSDGEALSTSLNDISLDDLINILIKVLG